MAWYDDDMFDYDDISEDEQVERAVAYIRRGPGTREHNEMWGINSTWEPVDLPAYTEGELSRGKHPVTSWSIWGRLDVWPWVTFGVERGKGRTISTRMMQRDALRTVAHLMAALGVARPPWQVLSSVADIGVAEVFTNVDQQRWFGIAANQDPGYEDLERKARVLRNEELGVVSLQVRTEGASVQTLHFPANLDHRRLGYNVKWALMMTPTRTVENVFLSVAPTWRDLPEDARYSTSGKAVAAYRQWAEDTRGFMRQYGANCFVRELTPHPLVVEPAPLEFPEMTANQFAPLVRLGWVIDADIAAFRRWWDAHPEDHTAARRLSNWADLADISGVTP